MGVWSQPGKLGHISQLSRTRFSHLRSGGSQICWFSSPGF